MVADAAIVGLDVGTRYTGVAVAQRSPAIALPHCVIEARTFEALWKSLESMPVTSRTEAWVLGLPLTSAGQTGKQAALVHKFARYLSYRHPAPIWLIDERMTSQAAARTSDTDRHDASAAALILASYLSAPELARRAELA